MIGPDTRPEVRVAFLNDDGTLDTTGQEAFGYYETLPNVGDIIVEPSLLDDSPDAVVVVGRQMIRTLGTDCRWWLIVRPAKGRQWREICQLDNETNKALEEMREERLQESRRQFLSTSREGKRRRTEASAARKASRPKGRQRK